MKIEKIDIFEKDLFINNICIIISIFCLLFFITAFKIDSSVEASKKYYDISEGAYYGPIVIKDKPKVCKIHASTYGLNKSSFYLSGEVLDEDKETLFEFGKEFWHEDGYDSEGYYSEGDYNSDIDLTFDKAGKYYIQFHSNNVLKTEKMPHDVSIKIELKKGSALPYLYFGILGVIIAIFVFFSNASNREWYNEFMEEHLLED